jgi:hypothetical protein
MSKMEEVEFKEKEEEDQEEEEEEEQETQETQETQEAQPLTNNINLQLGDIIQFDAPSDTSLHDKIYFIKFINQEKIVLINAEKTIKYNSIRETRRRINSKHIIVK